MPLITKTLRFHVLSDDLNEADKAALEGIAARREGTEVRFYSPAKLLSEEALRAIDVTFTGVTRAAYYYRILAADLLPADVHRALYLDGDILCTGSLEELFDLDLKGCPVGMGLDSFTTLLSKYNRLGYPPEDGYFCSGVILFDLDLWREENISGAMFDFLKANAKRLLNQDQDVINAVLHGRIFQIDFCYDVMWLFFHVFYWVHEEKNRYYAADRQFILKKDWPALLDAVNSPRLVHFDAHPKPWHKESKRPFTNVWRYFYAASPWAKEPLKWRSPPLKAKIKWLGRKVLERLNLIPPSIPYPEEAYMVARRMLDGLHEEDARGQ